MPALFMRENLLEEHDAARNAVVGVHEGRDLSHLGNGLITADTAEGSDDRNLDVTARGNRVRYELGLGDQLPSERTHIRNLTAKALRSGLHGGLTDDSERRRRAYRTYQHHQTKD